VEGISADRLEIFLAVRHDLLPMCEEFRKIGESFAAMDELDKGGDEPSKGEIFKAMGGLTGSIFGMVGNLGRFTELRNEALLGHGMSLGEYIWIYVLVYNSWLGEVPNRDFDGDARGAMSSKEQKVLVAMVVGFGGDGCGSDPLGRGSGEDEAFGDRGALQGRNLARGIDPGLRTLLRETGKSLLRGHVQLRNEPHQKEGSEHPLRLGAAQINPTRALNSSIRLSQDSAAAKVSVQKSRSHSCRNSSTVLPCCSTQVKYLKLCRVFRSR